MNVHEGQEAGGQDSESRLLPLTPEQRALFRNARRHKRLPVNRVPGVCAGTVTDVETSTRRHFTATLARLAEGLGMTPGELRDAGLPLAAGLLGPGPGRGPGPESPAREEGLPRSSLPDKIRWGMAARESSNESARAVALDMGSGLSGSELEALAMFVRDVADLLRQELEFRAAQ